MKTKERLHSAIRVTGDENAEITEMAFALRIEAAATTVLSFQS